MSRTPVTANAADRRQLRYAEKHNKRIEFQQRDDVRAALQHLPTRRLLMRILFEARCDLAHTMEAMPELTASTYDVSAKIHYHTGRRDLGLLLLKWIAAADPMVVVEMMTAQIKAGQQTEAAVAASHVPPVTGEGADFSQERTD